MSQRQFVFRWDVDHRVCVTDGIPRIRAVCRDFGVPLYALVLVFSWLVVRAIYPSSARSAE